MANKMFLVVLVGIICLSIFMFMNTDQGGNSTIITIGGGGAFKPNTTFSSQEAIDIITNSEECGEYASAISNTIFEKNTKTWWFILNIPDKPDCNPACTLYETGEVKLNMRCPE